MTRKIRFCLEKEYDEFILSLRNCECVVKTAAVAVVGKEFILDDVHLIIEVASIVSLNGCVECCLAEWSHRNLI